MMKDKIGDRRSTFKKTVDASDGSRRRNQTMLSLRKAKKDEHLSKRRHAGPAVTANPSAVLPNAQCQASPGVEKVYKHEDVPSLVETLRNAGSDFSTIFDAVQGIRRLLSAESSQAIPAVQKVVQAGALPLLIKCLDCGDQLMLQFEAAWALTNIASTDYTKHVLDAGAVPPMIRLLNSVKPENREQAVWCLGNIAGDCASFRDVVLEAGVIGPLINNLQNPAHPSLVDNMMWAISNFCRHNDPSPDLRHVGQLIPVLAYYLANRETNKELITADAVTDILWAISYLSNGDDNRIQAVVDGGIVPLLVGILSQPKVSVGLLTPIVRSIGNVVTGSEKLTQTVIDAGFMAHAPMLIDHRKPSIQKETCWLLSNIAAGSHSQISTLFNKVHVVNMLVENCKSSAFDIRKESIWAVANVFTCGSNDHVRLLAQCGGIEAICSALTVKDITLVMTALDAIDCLLNVGEKHNLDYDRILQECDGLDQLEALQESKSDKVYEKCVYIIENYFGAEEENENLVPTIDGDTFAFGPPKNLFGSISSSSPSSPSEGMTMSFNFGGNQSTNVFMSP